VRWPAAILDRACARRLQDRRSGRRNRSFRSNQGTWSGKYCAHKPAAGGCIQGVPRATTVGEHQELPGASDQGALVGLAACYQAAVERDQRRVPAERGRQCRRIERSPQTAPPAADAGLARTLAAMPMRATPSVMSCAASLFQPAALFSTVKPPARPWTATSSLSLAVSIPAVSVVDGVIFVDPAL